MGENLKMAKPDATDQEMREVLKKVNLLGFLDTQDGLDTVLLEKGGKPVRGSVPAPCDRKSTY